MTQCTNLDQIAASCSQQIIHEAKNIMGLLGITKSFLKYELVTPEVKKVLIDNIDKVVGLIQSAKMEDTDVKENT